MCVECNGKGYIKTFCKITEMFEFDDCWTCKFNEGEK